MCCYDILLMDSSSVWNSVNKVLSVGLMARA